MNYAPWFVTVEGSDAILQRGGLPYWIFWLLLCVILLLVAFIFLRDKDLRQRLSLSLYGPRLRLNRMTLEARLARERKKRSGLLRDLGREARRLRLRPPGAGDALKKLAEIEGRLESARGRMRRASARMEALLPGRKVRRPRRASDEEVRAGKTDLKRAVAEVAQLERQRDWLLEDLGRIVRDRRPAQKDLLPLYAQLDLTDDAVADFQTTLEKLGKA
jgi:hypothetical protein